MNKRRNMKKRKQDLFSNLPSEIIITEILSRLPARTILSCKCVCRVWRDLVETREFAESHLSRSVPGVALTIRPDMTSKTTQLTNVLDPQHDDLDDDLHFNSITKLNFTDHAFIEGSADGLLLLRRYRGSISELHLCNPITSESMDLHSHFREAGLNHPGRDIIYGFGVSRTTHQYKAIRIFHRLVDSKTYKRLSRPESNCEVYTVGTGSWRSITPHAPFHYTFDKKGAFVNGNLHWFVHDLNYTPWISCFDFETEVFTTFSPPPLRDSKSGHVVLVLLEGKLCLCDCTSSDGRIIIWLMNEYGVKESWTNEFVIGGIPYINNLPLYPIKLSKHGVILMKCPHRYVFYYNSNNKTTHKICDSLRNVYLSSISFTPSFVSLKSFRMEDSYSI